MCEVQLEIAGPTAMWTRPDTGDCPVSYPVPTYSAVKAIFESIAWGPAVRIRPIRVEICAPLQYHSYRTNYGGPLRKTRLVRAGEAFQLHATVLIDVCYRLYAEVAAPPDRSDLRLPDRARHWDHRTSSACHAYRDIFNRRLRKGQCFTLPFLGWKEFGPSYYGVFREQTTVQGDIQQEIPSMLREVFSGGYASAVAVTYEQNVRIRSGVMEFSGKAGSHAE
jgi:CRISPR-associated protein Cas5d